jgi:hypothetical protein
MGKHTFTRRDFSKAASMTAASLVFSVPPAVSIFPSRDQAFYVPENPRYTIVDSALDSIRFTLGKTLRQNEHGHLVSLSGFVDPEGKVMGWHDFGNLEGPGWAANAVGGAYEIYTLGDFLHKPEWQRAALNILDHVLDDGFLDEKTGFIRGYRETTTGRFCLNYKHNSDWCCPGSMAKIGFQLLVFSDELGNDPRAARMRASAVRVAQWIENHVETPPNGWFPRRTNNDGGMYRKTPEGGDDPFWQTSGDGLFILQLQAALTARGLSDYVKALREKSSTFIHAGGIFGSINQDTYDSDEDVSYAVAFRTLSAVSRVLKDDSIRKFANERCLGGLDQFKMREDRNGVATRGLLYMEKSWDTVYLWENAEAALAYLEAAKDMLEHASAGGVDYEMDGLVILRAVAKHHHGPYGFLTEGVDWNNHVGQQHHFERARFGDIRYTEPFLNNQHISEPTLYYLRNLARKSFKKHAVEWHDSEGNRIFRIDESSA